MTMTENEIDWRCSALCRELSIGHLASIETSLLQPAPSEDPALGSKPLWAMTDPDGRRYVFKVAEPALVAAELAAYELRRLGGRPCVPVRAVSLEIADVGVVSGILKPFLEFDPERELGADSRRWTELQRCVLLREQAWEWFLDNLDTNTSQYALLGADGYPVNLDWDRAFASSAHSAMSRFAKYKSALPNARTFLYADYVEGRIGLTFAFLRQEAKLIRRLAVADVRRITTSYARVRYEDDEARARELVERVLDRQRRIEQEVSRLVRDLRAERRQLAHAGDGDLMARSRALATLLWNHWQVALNYVVRGPAGKMGRKLLKLARARGAGVPTLLPVNEADSEGGSLRDSP
jgi:hypothetical protein